MSAPTAVSTLIRHLRLLGARHLVIAAVSGAGGPAAVAAQRVTPPPVVGRWDLTVTGPRGSYASWLELTASGYRALVGQFTGRIGGARPVGRAEWRDGVVRFSIPGQWDLADGDLHLEGRLEGGELRGTIVNPNGGRASFVGRRAPSLRRDRPPAWGTWVSLFNGRDLTGWTADRAGENRWAVRDGALANTAPGANLATTGTYEDFQLHAEFRVPAGGDGGISLRGRYEVQIRDDTSAADAAWPTVESVGGVYGFLAPSEHAATRAGVWQSFDITLVGRHVTVVLNGRTVIANQLIPGLTGSAVDADEGAPGPIVLQGEESALEFRNVRIREARIREARIRPRR